MTLKMQIQCSRLSLITRDSFTIDARKVIRRCTKQNTVCKLISYVRDRASYSKILQLPFVYLFAIRGGTFFCGIVCSIFCCI